MFSSVNQPFWSILQSIPIFPRNPSPATKSGSWRSNTCTEERTMAQLADLCFCIFGLPSHFHHFLSKCQNAQLPTTECHKALFKGYPVRCLVALAHITWRHHWKHRKLEPNSTAKIQMYCWVQRGKADVKTGSKVSLPFLGKLPWLSDMTSLTFF